MRLTLEDGEVGQLIVPVRVHAQVPPGEYAFTVRVESEAKPEALACACPSSENQIQGLRIRYPQGLGISQILSWGFEATTKQDPAMSNLKVVVARGAEEARSLLSSSPPGRLSIGAWLPRPARGSNERRPHILSELTADGSLLSMFERAHVVCRERHSVARGRGAVCGQDADLYGHALFERCGLARLLVGAHLGLCAGEGLPTVDMLWWSRSGLSARPRDWPLPSALPWLRRRWGASSGTLPSSVRCAILSSRAEHGDAAAGRVSLFALDPGRTGRGARMVMEGENVEQSLGLLRDGQGQKGRLVCRARNGEIWTNLLNLLVAKQEC